MGAFGLLEDALKNERSLHWQGTFAEYLDIVRRNPAVARSAHARVYDMIRVKGQTNQDGRCAYRFFTDHLFGIDHALQHLVEGYFRPAAQHLAVRHRILLLVGPVAAGKSSIAALLKRGLESYSRTDAGALYGLAGCPMHEEPLHLVPSDLRPYLAQELGVCIEGSLCPICRWRLQDEFHGRLEQFPVNRVLISEQQRVGIGTFQPRDPRNQDIAELTGSVDLAAISQYGAESDPRAYRFDGELNVANRGILEMQEMLKCDERFLWHLLSLAQEGVFKAGRFALISADEVVVGHCNEEDYAAFVADKRNKALLSRLLVIPVPYTMSASDEERIYVKMMQESRLEPKHLAPRTLRSLAQFAVLTREAENPTQNASRVGMHGMDPRLITNALSAALAIDASCVDATDVLRQLASSLESVRQWAPDRCGYYHHMLEVATQRHHQAAKSDVLQAVTECFFTAVLQMVEHYIALVNQYCAVEPTRRRQLSQNSASKEMQRFEAFLGVAETKQEAYRSELAARLQAAPDITALLPDNPLTLAQSELGMAGAALLLTQLDAHKIEEIAGCLQTRFGYCPLCARKLLCEVVGTEVSFPHD